MTITIHSIDKKYLLSSKDFSWLKKNLEKPLKLSALYFFGEKLANFTIAGDGGAVMTFFPENKMTFTISGAKELAGLHELEPW